ncbi:hypothetical protein Pan216_55560 [Planctomycetes bacterium Pan216]|uniref:STAS domain-containing protein n=1 Tax=Kolteria novifilia TaxID=2527975 RepID=A0A518BCF7_9BACT|nr:hypothetical protein Pan216_55560 [Planctomycetes bacterium Pan216]
MSSSLNVVTVERGLLILLDHDDVSGPMANERLAQELVSLCPHVADRTLYLDFSGVRSIDSDVLTLLLRARASLVNVCAQLQLCTVSENVRHCLKISQLERIFDVREYPDGPKHMPMAGAPSTPWPLGAIAEKVRDSGCPDQSAVCRRIAQWLSEDSHRVLKDAIVRFATPDSGKPRATMTSR